MKVFDFLRKLLYTRLNLGLSKLPPKQHVVISKGKEQVGLDGVSFDRYKFYFVCFGEKADSIYWLRDWLEVFLEFNVEFLIVLRSKELQNWVFENYPLIDSVTVNGFQSVFDLYKVSESTRLALYPINSMYNHMFVRLSSVRHVFIGHGDSDKLSSANKALRMFDEIWCTGQAQVDRMLNQDFDCKGVRLRKVGRPGLLRLFSASKEKEAKNKILYLPTWEGSDERWDYSSACIVDEILESIVKNSSLSVNVRLHPFIGRRKKRLKDKIKNAEEFFSENRKVIFSNTETPLIDILNNYDFFVCDVSSVVTDCLVLNRPIFLYRAECKDVEIAESNISLDDFCYIYSSAEEFSSKFLLVLEGDDYKARKRTEAAEYFIGLEETQNNVFKKMLLE